MSGDQSAESGDTPTPQSGHGLSLAARLRVLNETWCPTCPANAGEPCVFVGTYPGEDYGDRSSFKEGWPIEDGDPIPFFHYERGQRWYLYLGERVVTPPGQVAP